MLSTLGKRLPSRLVMSASKATVFNASMKRNVTASSTRSSVKRSWSSASTGDRSAEVQKADPVIRSRPPPEFDVSGKVIAVTGGGRGLGLSLAEYLARLGAHVYCLDILEKPAPDFYETRDRVAGRGGGSLNYRHLDVRDAQEQNKVFEEIANGHQGMHGLVSAAAVQNVTVALDYPPEKIDEMMSINYKGVFLSATACARQMIKWKCPGSIVLVGSMSAFIANRGLFCPVYNSSKAAVVQLGRNLAMEWAQVIDGKPIRVNSLCPGNIMTPMVHKNLEDEPHLKELWEQNNMMGRLSEPSEYNGAVLFMLSNASSFMTGAALVIDGGYTAW